MIDIDALKRDKRPQSSTIVHALIDRLEAAEADALEQARLNGMGSEREAALLSKLEAAEKERDECNRRRLEAADHFAAQTALMKQKYDDLRAKITEMEQQAPVAEWAKNRFHRYPQLNWADGYRAVIGEKLYALPGAQPAPSVPDGWKLVPMVSTHEMKEAGACAGAVYYAIAKDVWSAMLAAAPEAKP